MMRKIAVFFIAGVVFWMGQVFPQDTAKASSHSLSQIIEYLEFREVDIKDVLRQLAKQYSLNIVFSESVKGDVTVQLQNISIEEALDSIITVNGFSYTKKENVIKVTTPEEAEREGRFTKLFKLNNADAGVLKDTLKKVLSGDGSIESDSRSNSLVVTDYPSVISRIETMIADLDRITAQVLIEARFVEVSLTTSEKLGIDWSTKITAKGALRPTTWPYNTVPPFDNVARSFPKAVDDDFTFGVLDFTAFSQVFEFIRSRQNSELVANPRITTLDNQRAIIQVGKNVPIATFERNTETGRLELSGWEDEPERVGVILEVTPQVSPDGHIRLKIKPEVSEIDSFITIEGDEVRPITNTRTAETEVQIRDGQTVVIGGLIKDKITTTVKKVPFLADIPFLGSLFKSQQEGTEEAPSEKTDLLIFVTAKILKDSHEPLIGYERNLISSPPKPFKLDLKNISLGR